MIEARIKKLRGQFKKLKIVAIDFGIKQSILNRLVSHGCEVIVLPYNSSLEDVWSAIPLADVRLACRRVPS